MKRIFSDLPRGSHAFSIVSAAYLIIMWLLTGLRIEHWAIILAMNVLFYAGQGSRKFILGFAIFAVFGMLYDVMRAFPNYLYNTVDIEPLYQLEKQLFGIVNAGQRQTPNEFFSVNHCTAADFLSGFFYINWMPLPLAFALYLFVTDRRTFLHFSLTFLFVNLIGFMIYYIHPAAPPWYVSKYGFGMILNTPGDPANLARFDALIHINVFHSIYSKNANVFAAMPSLHCAYPFIVLYFGIKARCRWVNIVFAIFTLGIWFAAIYSGHHYTLDVLAGIACAIFGIVIYRHLLMRWPAYNRFTEKYQQVIS